MTTAEEWRKAFAFGTCPGVDHNMLGFPGPMINCGKCLREMFAAAQSESYAAGRRAGVEEAQSVIDRHAADNEEAAKKADGEGNGEARRMFMVRWRGVILAADDVRALADKDEA